ncbi:thiamine diphosphokinase [Halanaerobium praevalens]|uniref:Thiamine diphosphokinase n=1 Tax=Halanaerobium praevalens (strain ATCC 33744 / DSM 2228 / GSL) TaxID=572479 RepID=E3DQT5_HALPG|nr:thiamine diphosphokinase [Halanaerobium praevalens]ADO76910.1 thiamine pyrophosphokinase [Halanaerobium praevalens DSM 2228]
MSKNALLILNGELNLTKREIDLLLEKKEIDKLIAVDGGANRIKKINILPDLVIGDLDSLTKKNRKYYQSQKIEIIKHPVEKDQTDSELAIDYCLNNNFQKIYLTGALGGRFDQQLANLNLLEYIVELGLEAKIISSHLEIALIKEQQKFINKKGYRLSLIAQTKIVKGLTITGCKYDLDNEDLKRSQTRGISNLIKADKAEVKLENGLLIYTLEKQN